MLILASASPWRARLLQTAGFAFEILPTDIDEASFMRSISDPEQLVKTLALAKAQACLASIPQATLPVGGSNPRSIQPTIIVAADTIVWNHAEIIGKPKNRQDAHRIISLLAGNTHEVWTGVCIQTAHPIVFSEKTRVTFKPMTKQQIDTYLDTNDWVGKAGAYQIQKSIKKYVDRVEGDPDNIIGLPRRTILELKKY